MLNPDSGSKQGETKRERQMLRLQVELCGLTLRSGAGGGGGEEPPVVTHQDTATPGPQTHSRVIQSETASAGFIFSSLRVCLSLGGWCWVWSHCIL